MSDAEAAEIAEEPTVRPVMGQLHAPKKLNFNAQDLLLKWKR